MDPVSVPPRIKRYYDSAGWQRLRAAVFERDGYRCTRCGARGKQAGGMAVLNAAHIRSRRNGGTDTLANLRTMCNVCHPKSDAAGRRAERPTRCPHGNTVCKSCGFRASDVSGTTRAFG